LGLFDEHTEIDIVGNAIGLDEFRNF